MADWTPLDTNTLLPGEPFTSAILLALEENPRAIAEQSPGAPKLANKTVWASGTDITFSGLDDFRGIWIKGSLRGATTNSSGTVALNLTFSSDDGSSFATGEDIFDNSGALGAVSIDFGAFFEVFFDFGSGRIRCVGMASGDNGNYATLGVEKIISGASSGITDVKIESAGLSTVSSMRLMAVPQGGESAA